MSDALRAMINWQRDVNRPQGWYWDLAQHIPYENTRTLGRFWPGNIDVALQEFFQMCPCAEGTDDAGEPQYTEIVAKYNNGVKETYTVSEGDAGLRERMNLNTLDEGIKNNNFNDSRLYRLMKKAMENPDFISFTANNYDELVLTRIDVAERLI